MKFRPCIDIHHGKVKQIIGGTLTKDGADENFVSEKGAAYYAELFKAHGLTGGHAILLDATSSEYYEADKDEIFAALRAYKGGLMAGGGINDINAADYISRGASHVIVTSYAFYDGKINYDRLGRLIDAVGKEHLVLDLSCRKHDGKYVIMTNKWQKFTNIEVNILTLMKLGEYCDEFLIHAVDAEGRRSGFNEDIVKTLADSGVKATYAGGISSVDDIERLRECGKDSVDFTVGSALDIYGGDLSFELLCERYGR